MRLPQWIKRLYYPLLMIFLPKTKIASPENSKMSSSIYDIPLKDIDGNKTNLAPFKGKKLLIVNVASECGYTHQYAQLQELFEGYNDKLMVLGFPSNNFGLQEPGTNKQIKNFCLEKYKVSFPMFEKIDVVGKNTHPLYHWLSEKELNGWNDQPPKWNFCKYLVSENGELLNFFSETVSPFDEAIIDNLG